MFHCTIGSGSKWLRMSIVTNEKINKSYSIDFPGERIANPNYYNIQKSKFV